MYDLHLVSWTKKMSNIIEKGEVNLTRNYFLASGCISFAACLWPLTRSVLKIGANMLKVSIHMSAMLFNTWGVV